MPLPSVRSLIGSLVEVFCADLFNVLGLAVQKVAVMKLIETNRLRSALDNRYSDDEDDAFSDENRSFESLFGEQHESLQGEDDAEIDSEEERRRRQEGSDLESPLLSQSTGRRKRRGKRKRRKKRKGQTVQEDGSEVMTVASYRDVSDSGELVNDTQVPEISDLLRTPLWLVGLLVFILGNLSELVALSFASQTDIALLTNFALIWNAIASVFIFKEEFNLKPVYQELSLRLFRRWDLFHCFILLVGSMLAVYCTPQVEEDDLDSKELLHRWTAPPYSYWGTFMLASMFVTSLFLVRNWRNLKTGNLNAALIAGLCGFMSAFCVTLSKVTTTLISNTIKGKNQFDNPEAVFLVALWIVMLVCQLFLLNVALGSFEQGMVIPIYEIIGTIAAIVSGILFYRTYTEFTQVEWAGFGTGVFLMSWGVWLVAHREVHTQQELSDNLYANLSAVDNLLRVTTFSRYTSDDDGYVPFVGVRSAALDEFETERDGMDASTRQLYTASEGAGESGGEEAYEYTRWNLASTTHQSKS